MQALTLISNHSVTEGFGAVALITAIVLFLGFLLDVVLGAILGVSILNDVQEMLILFAASIAFVIVILRREANSKE